MLRDAGYDVTTCDQARECYRMIRDARPDVAIVDARMRDAARPDAGCTAGQVLGAVPSRSGPSRRRTTPRNSVEVERLEDVGVAVLDDAVAVAVDRGVRER